MRKNADILMQSGCGADTGRKVCRSRGGESCAFDGAMIVLQPIADAVHIVHGPIACCGNSWEGRGTLSNVGARRAVPLHKAGFTTDMSEMDIIYGSEEKLYRAILHTCRKTMPKAAFVYATCVSGLTGEDIESVCKKASGEIGLPVIPVNAPGFIGPKNLGNRIAGEVLLDHVIGTGEPPVTTDCDINLIGEYNIAGDLWLVEPVLKEAGIRVLSRLTGDSSFEEITYAHRAKLNVVVCSRALINVAKAMERKYGIPYIEVSFFGRTEMAKALRLIASNLKLTEKTEAVIAREERLLEEKLRAHAHLSGKRAVLYTGGVKSWSFISALNDLGIEIAAVGTKKSTFEDEEKMKAILGEKAPLVEDVTPKNLLRLIREKGANILIAGGRNQYLAVKEGIPFVDVNQERHTAYAGYRGLVNFAAQISNGINFYENRSYRSYRTHETYKTHRSHSAVSINPLKHSQSIGAAIAFQGVHGAIPVIHGAQGCSFLAKVLLTKHFREPIALASTKLFTENVVMGSEDSIANTVKGLVEKNTPEVIGILSSGLSEVKGDDVPVSVKALNGMYPECKVLHVPAPDYEGGLETGYAKAVEAMIGLAGKGRMGSRSALRERETVNILAGPHLTPADFMELREIVESFGLHPILLPDLSALDGSRQGISALASGGTKREELEAIGNSAFTFAIGRSMELPAKALKQRFGIEYRVFDGISGLKDTDAFMEALSLLSGAKVLPKYERQRRVLVDALRDAHFTCSGKRVCLALDHDLCAQVSRLIGETGAAVDLAVLPHQPASAGGIHAGRVIAGDLFSIEGEFDLLISNSHAEETAKRLGTPLCQMGFPVYKVLGYGAKVTIGYRGTLMLMHEIANSFKGSKEAGK
ncbi:MAG TPA: nitrogenase iron-molybdenum cofactor biosynthesis protein NifE [Dissulfurispiraceae bacterium]